MIIKGSKQESALIRWVQKGAATDKTRPILTGINVADGCVVACDGFRCHAAKAPECLPEGILQGKIPSGDFVAEVEPMNPDKHRYPEIHQVFPTGPVAFSIGVSAKYLKEALAGMDPARPTILRFFSTSGALEVFGKDKNENDLYALVMPMHVEEPEKGGWRPTKPNAEMLSRVKGKIADLETRIAEEAVNTEEVS